MPGMNLFPVSLNIRSASDKKIEELAVHLKC